MSLCLSVDNCNMKMLKPLRQNLGWNVLEHYTTYHVIVCKWWRSVVKVMNDGNFFITPRLLSNEQFHKVWIRSSLLLFSVSIQLSYLQALPLFCLQSVWILLITLIIFIVCMLWKEPYKRNALDLIIIVSMLWKEPYKRKALDFNGKLKACRSVFLAFGVFFLPFSFYLTSDF